MASSEKGKKLSDLLVIELRNYLKQRQLDHIGTKAVLAERLQQALISEGEDPNTYVFTNEKNINLKMETLKEKEHVNEVVPSILEENTNQVDDKFPVLEIDASNFETNFEETPMEIEMTGTDSGESECVFKTPSLSENMQKNADYNDKIELEAEINESFVLMIDELISEKFLEETQNSAPEEPDFIDANDVKLDEIEGKGEHPLTGLNNGPEEDPLYVEPLETTKENVSIDLAVNNSNEFKKNYVPNVQEKICNRELIVVVKRENFIENKGKILLRQSDEIENILPQDIKIKEEIIELSDDDMNSEENVVFQNIKQELNENIETQTNETKSEEFNSKSGVEEIKPDVMEQEETTLNDECQASSIDKERSSAAKLGIYSLKIENLISSVKAQELRQLLCDYAKILEVKVFHDNKKIYCYAFAKVEVKDLDEMLEKLNNLEYKGTFLSVTKMNDNNNTLVNKEVQKMRSIKSLEKKKTEGEEKIEPKELDRNLWVTNLLQNTKAQDIKQLLSQHAKVIGVKVVKSSSDPSKNCYGYVTLESKNDVDLCIQRLDKTTFNGRVIRLSATKKAPVLDTVTDKNVKKSPEMDTKGSNNLKPSDKKKTLKKSDDLQKDDKRSEGKKESYEKCRSDRERLQREKDRIRLEEERVRQDVEHAREILHRQREEARLLEREREKIRKEREYLERQRMEILRMERERQRIEREKIEKEKEELRRQQQKLDEARRAEKRASSGSSGISTKRSYVSPKQDKPKKGETHDFSKENEDQLFSKRHGEYSKRMDKYPKRTEDFQKRPEDYPKRTSDYHKRLDDYPKRTEMYPRRVDDYPKRVTDDFPKRFDHYTKPDEIYPKEDYHKRPEFPNYKREDRTIGPDFKRDYQGHANHHVPSAINNSGYNKFEATYHPDREKMMRQPARKDIPTKEPKPIGYNDRTEITSTEAYRSIIRDDRDRERKSGVDYTYKNDNRIPLLKDTPRYKDEGSPWAAVAAPVKTFRDVENPNTSKDTWWRKWDGQWNAGTSTEYPGMNYNSGPACPPPPGINNYPMNNHFGNYRKY